MSDDKKNLGFYKVVGIISFIASITTIFVFLTGWNNIRDILSGSKIFSPNISNNIEPTQNPLSSNTATSSPAVSYLSLPNTIGTWIKSAPNSCCLDNIEIRESAGNFFVHIWGEASGVPNLGDWGEQLAHTVTTSSKYLPGANEYLAITWKLGGNRNYEILTQIVSLSDGKLEIWIHSLSEEYLQIFIRK